MQLNQVKEKLIYSFKNDAELIEISQQVRRFLTSDRDKLNNYLLEEKQIAAYTVFYMLTDIPHFKKVWDILPSMVQESILQEGLIDIGHGPGTLWHAWKEFSLSANLFFAVETSALMRQQAYALQQEKYLMSSSMDNFAKKAKNIIFTQSANEMGPQKVLAFIDQEDFSHIIFITPGTHEIFHSMLNIRRELIDRGYHILYPCSSSRPCPMQGTQDWCHQLGRVSFDQDLARLCQMANFERHWKALGVFVFSKRHQPEKTTAHIVRVLKESKHAFEWQVCLVQDNQNRLLLLEIPKKDFAKVIQKQLKDVLPGASLVFTVVKDLSETRKRARLLELNGPGLYFKLETKDSTP